VGRLLILVGVALVVVGLVVAGLERVGLGQLPGTIRFQRGSTSFWFPLGASLLGSLLLTVVLNLFLRLFSRP
jgi:hypothetical protein